MIFSNKQLLVFLILLQVVFAKQCEGLDTECLTCCKKDPQGGDAEICDEEILNCPLNPNPDFSVLITILYILGGFIVGIPVFLFIVDKVLFSNLFNCKMSFCECVANYICCCFCLSRDKPPIEFDDVEEQENFDDKRKKSNKVVPENP